MPCFAHHSFTKKLLITNIIDTLCTRVSVGPSLSDPGPVTYF